MDRGAYAPVSVYRKVCGDFPFGVVCNTGAFSFAKRKRRRNNKRRLKMNKNIPIEIGDQVSELVCLLTYHAACLSCYLNDSIKHSEFSIEYANDFTTGIFLALRDLEQRARKIEKALG
jgi:hypothetical protein